MKKIGITEPTWSPKVALQKQIEREDLIAWAKRPIQRDETEELRVYINIQSEFKLTEAAKEAFTRSINYFKL